jgi:hypothetical protein
MATEAILEARHEAIKALHRAISELEAGDAHEAERAAHTAIAWIREFPTLPKVKAEAWVRECSCGRPRDRGTFCAACYPAQRAPIVAPRDPDYSERG